VDGRWLIGFVVADNPKLPLVLIVYAFQTVLTTATCMAEYFSWTNITFQEKIDLTTLYGPYLALCKSFSSPCCPPFRFSSGVFGAFAFVFELCFEALRGFCGA
jgi:hypothetical protein